MSGSRNDAFLLLLDEAVLDPARWPSVLSAFGDLFGCFGTALLSHSHAINIWTDVDPAAEKLFFGRFIDNPIQNGIDRLKRSPGGLPLVVPDWELAERSDYIRTEFFNEFVRPFGGDTVTVINLPSREGYAAINFSRSPSKGALPAAALEQVRALQPALARALWLSIRLAARDTDIAGLEGFFDHAPHAVFLTRRDGRVSRANRAAEAMIRAGNGLSIVQGYLRALAPGQTARIQALIAAAGSGEHPGTATMRLATPDRTRPWLVQVSPVRSARQAAAWGGPSAIVCVTDLDAVVAPPARVLRDVLGLTETEARIALALLDGASPKEAAAAMGLSFFTVRNHLTRIFQKTDTNRQADLVRLLVRVAGLSPSGL